MLSTSRLLSSLFCAVSLAAGLCAQPPQIEFPAPSPLCSLRQRVGLTDIEISYSRPGVKDRLVFGGIVPYGQVWRTGANASTKISFSTPVKLNGVSIPAGRYALYTIPGEKEWTIIIYKDTTLWGALKYDPKDDLARFKAAPAQMPDLLETFTTEFNDIRDESATLNLAWEKTRVPIRIEVDLETTLLPQIDAAMASPEKKSAGFYYQAATYYFTHGRDLRKTLSWVNTALAEQPRTNLDYQLLYLKARILARVGDRGGAIAAARESTEAAVKIEGASSSFVRMNADLITSLQ